MFMSTCALSPSGVSALRNQREAPWFSFAHEADTRGSVRGTGHPTGDGGGNWCPLGWTGAGGCGRGQGLGLHPSPLWVLFWLPFTICGILAPRPGIEPRPLVVKAQSPNLWNSPRNSHLCGLNLDSLVNLLVPERNWVEPQPSYHPLLLTLLGWTHLWGCS